MAVRGATLVVLMVLAPAAAGCAGNIGAELPTWAGGEPAHLPKAKAETAPYPNVQEIPPAPAAKLMSEQEQNKNESELTALRARVNAKGTAVRQQRPSEPAPADRSGTGSTANH